jgi:amino acid transporter
MATTEPQHDQHARDAADLAKFGYQQELKRSLGLFSSFATAFSYISPSTGIFTLFFLALGTAGGLMFWTWPIVALGQLFVALNFAELSSHYPVAGSVFQWTKYLSGRTYAWFTGWIYLFAGVITVAAVCATLPLSLIGPLNSMFGWHLNNTLGSSDQRVIAIITLAVVTILNIYGVNLIAMINRTGVIFEILGMVVFAFVLALFHNHSGVGVIFKSGGAHVTGGIFLVAMFMSLFVIYGFDTASTLAEETKDPRREAPKAVIGSLIGALIIGAIFLWGTLMAIPNLKETVGGAITNFTGPQNIIEEVLSKGFSTVYLLVVSAAIFICCMSIMTSTVRLCFGMARDEQLPMSKSLARVSPRFQTPFWSCIAIAVLSAIPFLQFTGATIIAVAATAMIYLSYLLGNLAVLRARYKGWPRVSAPFKLGSWGKPVNVIAILWGAGMLVNFLWYTNSTDSLRIISNPKPNQTGGLVHFGGFLNKIPLIELLLAVVVIVGAVYYFGFQRRKPFTPVIPPEEVTEAAR